MTRTAEAQHGNYARWYANHLEELQAKARAKYHGMTLVQKKARVAAHRLRQHGVTADWYRDQLVGQAGRCAICGNVLDPSRKGTHIDHDHRTDEPRGLLCPSCNLLLGHAHDSEAILAKAITYLRSFHNAKEPAADA
jgi:hypothetical protein